MPNLQFDARGFTYFFFTVAGEFGNYHQYIPSVILAINKLNAQILVL